VIPARTALAPASAVSTRDLILDAAERLFAVRGVDGVAIRDLARELGLTPSSLYNHFRGKQALYEAVLQRGIEPLMRFVGNPEPRELRREHVRATIDRMVPYFASRPHMARLLQRAMLEESDAVQALIARWVGSLYREGLGVVGTAAEDAGWEPGDAQHLAVVIFGAVFGYFANAAALERLGLWDEEARSPAVLDRQRRLLEETVFRLLGPRRKPR